MKKTVTVIIMLILCLTTAYMSYAASCNDEADVFISVELYENTALEQELITGRDFSEPRTAQIKISEDKKSAEIALEYNGYTYIGILTVPEENFYEINCGDMTGYVGTYEGVLLFNGEAGNCISAFTNLTFTKTEMFAMVYIYDTSDVILFGELSENIRAVLDGLNAL